MRGSTTRIPAFLDASQGDVTAPTGFRAAGVHCGVKKEGRDLALVASDHPAIAAGVFTTNRVQAAPVRWSRNVVRSGRGRAIVANSGNANACTGAAGEENAAEMAALTASALSIPVQEVLVASTGVIGVPLPMDRIRRGIPEAAERLEADGAAAAEAILTTDTVPKTAGVAIDLGDGRRMRIGGIAKGAGMIRPDLATMLCFLTTDAQAEAPFLQQALAEAVELSFNRITVDGDTSTNDCVLLLANGASGVDVASRTARERFTAGLLYVATTLAKLMVQDGEGATRLVCVEVEGATDDGEAKRAALTVADSLLVKTALHGGEPNWGRILAAVGRSGVEMAESRTAIWFNALQVVENGLCCGSDLAAAAAELRQDEVKLRIDLGSGEGRARAWTCDLSDEYVRINGSYIS